MELEKLALRLLFWLNDYQMSLRISAPTPARTIRGSGSAPVSGSADTKPPAEGARELSH